MASSTGGKHHLIRPGSNQTLCGRQAAGVTMILLIWPDGSWMYKNEYNEILEQWRGDDYFEQKAPDDLEDIDDFCYKIVMAPIASEAERE